MVIELKGTGRLPLDTNDVPQKPNQQSAVRFVEPDAANASGFDRSEASRPGSRGTQLFILISLAVGSLAVYSRVLPNEFCYLDDRHYITENPEVQAGLSWKGVIWAFTTTHGSNWHPLTWLSHMLDCQLFGLNPRWHHLHNVLLHVASACLWFLALTRMTKSVWPSALVAAWFALHPLHVESVAWVAERKDVLSTFFAALTVLAYARYAERPNFIRYLFVFTLYLLGLLAKPMLVTLPCVLLLLDYWPLRRLNTRVPASPRFAAGWRLCLLEKAPLFALVAISCAATLFAQNKGGALVNAKMLALDARVGNALVAYVAYLSKTFWPAGLAVYYPFYFQIPPIPQVVGAIVILAAISLAAMASARKHPYLLVGWLWYLGTLVPVIGLVQVGSQSMADRYTYLPLMGIFFIVAWGFPAVVARIMANARRTRIVVRSAAILTVAAMIPLTWIQIGHWRDSVTLFRHALDVTDRNAQAHIFMAQALYPMGRREEAIEHYAKAVEIVPNEPYNLYNLGLALYQAGRIDESIPRFEGALRVLPEHGRANFWLGEAYLKRGRIEEALRHSTIALAKEPMLIRANENIGAALIQLGRYHEAVAPLQRWLKANPKANESRIELARAYLMLGRLSDGEAALLDAARFDPANPHVQANLGQLFAGTGRFEQAIVHYRRSLEIVPDYVEAAANLARILATHRDEQFRDAALAVELAERAANATRFQNPVVLDVLAAAYACAGRFDEAVKTAESALSVLNSPDSPVTSIDNAQSAQPSLSPAEAAELKSLLHSRLVLYRRGVPLREPPDGEE